MMRRYEIVMAVEAHVLSLFVVSRLPLSLPPVVLSFPRERRERKYKLSFTLRYFDTLSSVPITSFMRTNVVKIGLQRLTCLFDLFLWNCANRIDFSIAISKSERDYILLQKDLDVVRKKYEAISNFVTKNINFNTLEDLYWKFVTYIVRILIFNNIRCFVLCLCLINIYKRESPDEIVSY